MNRADQIIAIAKVCGWTCCGQVPGCCPHGLHPSRKIDDYTSDEVLNSEVPIDTLPDYLNNLNAMHEAEKVLDYLQESIFCNNLFRVIVSNDGVSEFQKVHATAAQRAEAFLKTLNLWKP